MAGALDPEVAARVGALVCTALGGDTVVRSLVPGGHYPRAHLTALVSHKGGLERLFLKALKPERRMAEEFAYAAVLPALDVRTARLYGTFPDWELPTIWLILEQVQGRWADPAEPADMAQVFATLARLHRSGAQGTAADLSRRPEAPRLEAEELRSMLRQVEAAARPLELGRAELSRLENACQRLATGPATWTHGDLHRSNTLLDEESVGLVDWELVRWGPPAADLGNLCGQLSPAVARQGLQAYAAACQQAGSAPEFEVVLGWARDGLCHDALRWLAYVCELRREDEGRAKQWFEDWGRQKVARVTELARTGTWMG